MWSLIALLLIAWLLALLTSQTFGGAVHVLPAVAVVLLALIAMRRMRRVPPPTQDSQSRYSDRPTSDSEL